MGAIRTFVDAVENRGLELHSFILHRDGMRLAECYWEPYTADRPHVLYSLSKSFTSTAVGLAVGEGRMSLDDPVVSFFPEDLPDEVSPNLAAMKVRHLLSMSGGHAEECYDGRESENWVRAFLAHPVPHEPGTHFLYNSLGTYMCSAIVQKVTGETLLNYLEPRLFGPLGICEATWESCPLGINVGGWGLAITTNSISRFGHLYLQDGVWEGRRLLPVGWVSEATRSHVSNGDDPNSDWAQGYGFQFWRSRNGAYRGDGAFGQFCLVMPDQKAVVAITASSSNLQGVLDAVWEHLLPEIPMIEAEEVGRRQVAAPSGDGTAPKGVLSRNYSKTHGDSAIENVRLEMEGERQALCLRDAQGDHRLIVGTDRWIPNPGLFGALEVACKGAWTGANRFEVKVCDVASPMHLHLAFDFGGDDVLGTVRRKGTFMPEELPNFLGKATPLV